VPKQVLAVKDHVTGEWQSSSHKKSNKTSDLPEKVDNENQTTANIQSVESNREQSDSELPVPTPERTTTISSASPTPMHSSATQFETDTVPTPKVSVVDLNDPIQFAGRRLRSHDINSCLNSPCQPSPEFKYPAVNGRCFNTDWFFCEMPDTTRYRRNWLSYSISTDKAYCITCIAFAGPLGSEVWTTAGYNDWRNANGTRDVKRHECSDEHRNAEIARLQW